MSNAARWLVTIGLAVLLVALVAFARGDEERGADTTTVTTAEVSATTTATTESMTTTTTRP